eukprot:9282664-Pyramimonas_sp.AAC.1
MAWCRFWSWAALAFSAVSASILERTSSMVVAPSNSLGAKASSTLGSSRKKVSFTVAVKRAVFPRRDSRAQSSGKFSSNTL